ncbi:hypothetical protein ACET3Z_007436 [Daucus carota]
MSDHMGGSSIQEATSGGFQTGKKRVPQSPDHMNVGGNKRRGCLTALDRFLLQRQSNIQSQSSRASETVRNSVVSSPKPLSVNAQSPMTANNVPEVVLNSLNHSSPSLNHHADVRDTGAVRRRRGPNVNNLFKSNSLRSPDSTDKENECSGMPLKRKVRGPSIENQLRMNSDMHGSPMQVSSRPFSDITNVPSSGSVHSSVSIGELRRESVSGNAKRRGRGFSIEKQLQMAESHTLPTQSSDGSSSVLAGHGQRRRGRGPNVSTLLDKGKKVKSGPSQKLYQTPAISCVLNGADDTGVSQSNTDGSERSTTGVRNLLHVFNEADDNNSDEEQFDETGMPS